MIVSECDLNHLVSAGFKVFVEREAGLLSQFPDSAYLSAGVEIVSRKAAWKADIGVCHQFDLYNINPT